jgi:hypothetical protein
VKVPTTGLGTQAGVKIAAIIDGRVYRVDAAIPRSLFGVIPVVGERFGFAFAISYDYTPGTREQWLLISGVATQDLTNPATWGSLVLAR